LILQTASGELMFGAAEAGGAGFQPRQLSLRPDRLRRLLGVEIPPDEAFDALGRLQLSPVRQRDGIIHVTVPSWRLDLNLEVDLIEEVARVVGYDRIPTRGEISIALVPPEPQARAMELIRETLVAAGFFEAVTFTFVSDNLAGDFVPPGCASLPRADAAVRKADARLRPSLLPGLLESVRRNESVGVPNANLFETGAVFAADSAGNIHERRMLALVGGTDLRETRGAIEALLEKLDAGRRIEIMPQDHPGYASGAAAAVAWGGKVIGRLGRVHRRIAEKLSLRESPTAAELDLPALIDQMQHVPQLRPLPRFPAVRRDLSLVVSESVHYAALESLVAKLNLADLEAVEYVTTYRGKPLDKQSKSLTITLIFRSSAGTLTSEQVEGSMQRVIDGAGRELKATLRT
jgi:phenylalanyl-tRNA synthetase beta chain